jgi:hypothetical protein
LGYHVGTQPQVAARHGCGAEQSGSTGLCQRKNGGHTMRNAVLRTSVLCLVLAGTLFFIGAGLATDDPTWASSPHRILLPMVRRSFPRPTPTPTPPPVQTAEVTVRNRLNCTLNLQLRGPAAYDWSIPAQSSTTYTVHAGTYSYTAITTCCGTATGTWTFSAGWSYTKSFYCF